MAAIPFSFPNPNQQTNPQPNIDMTSTTPTLQSASLHFREGNSDKVYHAAIEPKGEGYLVTFAYGRRGQTLNTGTKTTYPVSLAEATRIFDKLVASKVAKGYHYSAASAGETKPYQQTGDEGRDSGIRCQLLNAIDESELSRLLTGRTHCLQEKHDGRRLMVRKQGNEITGINRRGLVVAIPDAIREAAEHIPFDVLIDGEAVGDTLHAFDLLEVKGTCLRKRRYIDRFAALIMTIPPNLPALRWVSTSVDPNDKVEIYEELRATNREGVVFKDMDAAYSPGRPNSGGPQLKFKFVESASFVVTGINAKRSVTLGLYDGDTLVPAGNVTIPPNHAIPQVGNVVDARYLYALKQSGSIYQPVYLGVRSDIPASECVVEQLKYKNEPTAAVA
jgi:bifunctional non-homologous end joining protein LigD